MSSINDYKDQPLRFHDLAQKIEPSPNQPQITLPEAQLQMLRQMAARARDGAPLVSLFAGTDKPAKAAAAALLAKELNRTLYRIDLAAIVSKYIGETEKNLRLIFDAAEASQAILFFDEADALFGKRSEVKDSHDRYANIEVSYLLQCLEQSHATGILAAHTTNWPPGLLHRIHFVLHFPPNPAP